MTKSFKLAFAFYQNKVVVGRSDWEQLPLNNTGQYFHMEPDFIRPRSIELNDGDIEIDLEQINEVNLDIYIGDDVENDSNSKMNKSQTDEN